MFKILHYHHSGEKKTSLKTIKSSYIVNFALVKTLKPYSHRLQELGRKITQMNFLREYICKMIVHIRLKGKKNLLTMM